MTWAKSASAGAIVLVMVIAACGGTPGVGGVDPAPPADIPVETTEPATTVPSPGPVLVGTGWNVTYFNLGSAGLTNPWPGTQITIRFGDDGNVSGSGGCNEYQGTFETSGPYDEFEDGVRDSNDGQAISFGPMTATKRGCAEPSGIMEQELDYLAALANVGRWVLARDTLSLRTSEGFALIEAEPLG